MKTTIQKIVEQLGLLPHPEGGFYSETYRGISQISTASGDRSASTAIYFLLTANNFSALHRINSDELWHHYLGDPVHIHAIDQQGNYQQHLLGINFPEGQNPQITIPAGQWFGSESIGPFGYSLVGCTVSPGFDFADFELGNRQTLFKMFPQHQALIERLTRSAS